VETKIGCGKQLKQAISVDLLLLTGTVHVTLGARYTVTAADKFPEKNSS
jgi:hypothetical protein